MNTRYVVRFAQMVTELALREPEVRKNEDEAVKLALVALKQCHRDSARQWFDVSMAWNQLREFTQDWKASLNSRQLIYIVDTWFLRDLILHLTPNQDEEITYVTGVNLGP